MRLFLMAEQASASLSQPRGSAWAGVPTCSSRPHLREEDMGVAERGVLFPEPVSPSAPVPSGNRRREDLAPRTSPTFSDLTSPQKICRWPAGSEQVGNRSICHELSREMFQAPSPGGARRNSPSSGRSEGGLPGVAPSAGAGLRDRRSPELGRSVPTAVSTAKRLGKGSRLGSSPSRYEQVYSQGGKKLPRCFSFRAQPAQHRFDAAGS